MPRRLLVVQVAALGHDLTTRFPRIGEAAGLTFSPIRPTFPAVTCTAQASVRTGSTPAQTGIVCNGRFDRLTRKTEFWNQSARLVHGSRVWEPLRARGGAVGMLFWQQSLGECVDILLSPAPIHKHHGGMIDTCYAKPADLYRDLQKTVGRPFRLRTYWGPLASNASSRWIADATKTLIADRSLAPELLFTYLPHLDYILQKEGPETTGKLEKEVDELATILQDLRTAADNNGYDLVVWGDYPIVPARRAAMPNRLLREHGLFTVRQVGRRTYPDLYESRAFAMVDHQVAHVFVKESTDLQTVSDALADMPEVDAILPHSALDHPQSGDLIAVAKQDAWFAYPWWDARREAPDYATHVDIHNKIGFDPCELFHGFPPLSISLDPGNVRGTHGRDDQPAAFATTVDGEQHPETLPELGRWIGRLTA